MSPVHSDIMKLRGLALGVDFLWLCVSGLLAFVVRFLQAPPDYQFMVSWPYVASSAVCAISLWLALGVPSRTIRLASSSEINVLGFIAVVAPLAGLAASFMFDRGVALPRSIVILHILLLASGLVLLRLGGRLVWHMLHRQQDATATAETDLRRQKILLIGDGFGIESYLRALQALGRSAPREITTVVVDPRLEGMSIWGQQLAGPQSLQRVSDELPAVWKTADQVVVACPQQQMPGFLEPILQSLGNVVRFDLAAVQAGADEAASAAPSEDQRLSAQVARYMPVKRAIDMLAAASALVVLAVPIALTALGVRIIMGRPVLFWQWRPGRNGSSFRLFKFRSMRNVTDKHGRVLSDAERLGAFGRFIRRTRLDELPQLWSILLGDMSLIGPRPLIVQHQSKSSRRLLLRPGLSGWAQVNGGQLLADDQKLAMDEWYVNNASLATDARIILLTVRTVLFGDKVPEGFETKADPFAGAQLLRVAPTSSPPEVDS